MKNTDKEPLTDWVTYLQKLHPIKDKEYLGYNFYPNILKQKETKMKSSVKVNGYYFKEEELLFIAFILLGESYGFVNTNCLTDKEINLYSDIFDKHVKEFVLGEYNGIGAIRVMLTLYCLEYNYNFEEILKRFVEDPHRCFRTLIYWYEIKQPQQ